MNPKIASIFRDLNTLGNGLEIVLEVGHCLLGLARHLGHKKGGVWLYIKDCNIQGAVTDRWDLNNEVRVGTVNKMTTLVEDNPV